MRSETAKKILDRTPNSIKEKVREYTDKIVRDNKLKNDMENKKLEQPIIRILNGNYETIMTIGAWNSCEHELKDLAIEFVEKINKYYENQSDNKEN